jgi:hypothetical protein
MKPLFFLLTANGGLWTIKQLARAFSGACSTNYRAYSANKLIRFCHTPINFGVHGKEAHARLFCQRSTIDKLLW